MRSTTTASRSATTSRADCSSASPATAGSATAARTSIRSNGADRRFFFPDGGSTEWVVIHTTDGQKIHALEFLYGNGWTTGDIYGPYPWGNHDAQLEWQTWRSNTLVSSGTVGISPVLEMGTVIGFRDPSGFDRILLRCTIWSSADPSLQALALDNLQVQLTSDPTWTDLGQGLAGVSGVPQLVGSGPLTPGSSGSMTLTNARPSSGALLLLSFSSAPVPFRGGTLVAHPAALRFRLATDLSGAAVLPFLCPAGMPPGTTLFLQCAVLDPAAVQGVSLSNAVRALTP